MFAADTTWTIIALWAAIGYLAGSIPFGILVTRVMGLGDVRNIGSGNIGTTNVLRTGSKAAAAATLLLDGGKGAVVVLIAKALTTPDVVQVAALAAFLGHCFPFWLRFKGGKGVATFLGILLALNLWLGLAACATWLAVAMMMRFSSLAALMSAGMSPLWAVLLGQGQFALLCLILGILIYFRHWANIRRLRAGTEPKIGSKA